PGSLNVAAFARFAAAASSPARGGAGAGWLRQPWPGGALVGPTALGTTGGPVRLGGLAQPGWFLWPQDGGCEGAAGGGQGGGGGGWEVLAGDAPQREPGALGEHDPCPG